MPFRIERIPLTRVELATDKMNRLEAEGWELVPPLLPFNMEALAIFRRRSSLAEAMAHRSDSKAESLGLERELSQPSTAKKKRRKKKAA